jgi:hypothetical protein
MHYPHEQEWPDGLQDIAGRLRSHREQASALELDQIKLRAVRQASRGHGRQKGPFMRSRFATLLTVGLLTAGAGGTFAIAKHDDGGGNNGSAAKAQYKPGCGPKKSGGVDGSGAQHTGPPGHHDGRDDCPK